MTQSLSRKAVEKEMREQEKDLLAFSESLRILEVRCLEARDSEYQPILDWQGLDASLFVLGSCAQKLKGIIQEYQEVLRLIDEGVIDNTDQPTLRLIED